MVLSTLTNEIDDPQSPVYQAITENFPGLRAFSSMTFPIDMKDLVLPPRISSRYPYAMIGTAFDYGLRLMLGESKVEDLIAWRGINICCEIGRIMGANPNTRAELGITEAEADPQLDFELSERFSSLTRKARHDRDLLCRMALALASFESEGRGSSAPGKALPRGVDDMLDRPAKAYIEDVAALIDLAEQRLPHAERVVLNPILGKAGVSADADLVLDGLLIELKCSIQPKTVWASAIRQALGYALMDDDELGLDGIGVYLARQGHFAHWSLSEIMEKTGSPTRRWEDARSDFEAALWNTGR